MCVKIDDVTYVMHEHCVLVARWQLDDACFGLSHGRAETCETSPTCGSGPPGRGGAREGVAQLAFGLRPPSSKRPPFALYSASVRQLAVVLGVLVVWVMAPWPCGVDTLPREARCAKENT